MSVSETLVELFEEACRRHAERPSLGIRVGGEFRFLTYAEVSLQVTARRALLAELGVEAGQRVAIIADNGQEWAYLVYATVGRRAVFVPMYAAQSEKDWRYILSDSQATVCFVGDQRTRQAIEAMRGELPQLRHVISFADALSDPEGIEARLARLQTRTMAAETPAPDDIAGFVYTSGTTGVPKGAILTHRNIVSNAVSAASLFPMGPTDRSLSFLPWAHAMGQTADLHALFRLGVAIGINGSVASLLENLQLVRPTVLIAVPRVFHRIYENVRRQIDIKPAPVRALFAAGIDASTRRARGESLGPLRTATLALADGLLFSKIRKRFGGSLRFAVSGSAALSREVAEFVNALGIDVYEGYGLTEASPIVSVNCPSARRFGTVGKPLPGVEVTIDRDIDIERGDAPSDQLVGEILVRGPNVMKGYHQAEEDTAQVLMPDGSLRTGDFGYLDQDGYLVVTGRLKEKYKLENGKYVVPAPLEEHLKLSPLIGNCMIYGADRPYNVLLVFPEMTAVRERIGIDPWDPGARARIEGLLKEEVARFARDFRSYERPKRLLLLEEDFTIQNGLLTPSMKIRRGAVLERYQERLRTLYNTPAAET